MEKNGYIVPDKKAQIYIDIDVQVKTFAKDIVKELIAERKRLGLTQQQIADLTGMKAPNITRIESCKYTPSLDVLVRYANALGKKIEFTMVDNHNLETENKIY